MSFASENNAAQVIQIGSNKKPYSHGVSFDVGNWPRVFTKKGIHPYDEIEWKLANAEIKNSKDEIVFEQKNVEVPSWWNQNTINIVADKYFRIIDGVRENSVKQIFSRVSSKIRSWASQQNFFNTEDDAEIFELELIYSLVHQYGAFNSPVWFNLGVPGRRQAASACFISRVEDSVKSIMDFQEAESTIFCAGSGSGASFSSLRSSYEKISSGAYTCGPLSWMKANDKFAEAFKSGGSTRAAAKLVSMSVSHPDILQTRDKRPGFIRCKSEEEKLAHNLVKLGYPVNYDDPNGAYKRVNFQNANNSVNIPDEFMQAVVDDGMWQTKEVTTGKVVHNYKARELWHEIAEAAWVCGDPGVQFYTTINKWHTTPKAGNINSSNPCSEFLNVDDTACNLCAVNLTKFFDGKSFNYERFAQSVRLYSTAQMAIVDMAEYPTEAIAHNSKKLRPIGINYGDLGSLLMKLGFGYDSDEGRAVAARLASLMTGLTYLNAAKLASKVGPFKEFENNKKEMLDVMSMHQEADSKIVSRWNLKKDPIGQDMVFKSSEIWEAVLDLGNKFGYYVSQASLMAPLGSISFLMGMSTTGIEPAFSLVSYKSLVGGGFMKIVDSSIPESLRNLGYDNHTIDSIIKFVEGTSISPVTGQNVQNSIEDSPDIKPEHISVFDCAMPARDGGRYLTPMAHLKMMAAIQPLITCAQSKTVNLPNSITPEEISNIYMESWRLGLKCVALYRDGCKASQPLSTTKSESKNDSVNVEVKTQPKPSIQQPIQKVLPVREKLPSNLTSYRHRFEIDGYKGYIIVGVYPNGNLGEVFLKLGKTGSTVSGLIDGFTQLLSLSLQYGIPLPKLIESFIETKFEPSGMTDNKEIRFAKSLYDYLFKWLDVKFYNGKYSGLDSKLAEIRGDVEELEPAKETAPVSKHGDYVPQQKKNLDSPLCTRCGSITQRSGSCHICPHCGTSSGCS